MTQNPGPEDGHDSLTLFLAVASNKRARLLQWALFSLRAVSCSSYSAVNFFEQPMVSRPKSHARNAERTFICAKNFGALVSSSFRATRPLHTRNFLRRHYPKKFELRNLSDSIYCTKDPLFTKFPLFSKLQNLQK